MSDLTPRERELFERINDIRRMVDKNETREYPSGSDTFVGMVDTPAAYAGAANYFVRVNGAGTALVFGTVDWADIYNKPSTFVPTTHGSVHRMGGSDPVGTVVPAGSAIPYADASGLLDAWISPAGTLTRGRAAFVNTDFTVNDGTVSLGTVFPRYTGVPSAGALAYWTGAGTVAHAGFGTADVARLDTDNTFTGNQTISGTAVTGNALRVSRNLTATSTNAPVVDIVQDHASDDQAALRVQQDGTGKIITAFDGASEVFAVHDGGIGTMGTGAVLDTTAMQLSSSVFTNAFFTTVAAATGSRAEVIHVWKISDSDDFFALTNTDTTNGRFGANFLFRNISSNAESFAFSYETLAANDTGSAPAVVIAGYTRTSAQSFGALATRPILAIRNLSTNFLLVHASGRVNIGPTSARGKLDVDQDSSTAAIATLVLDQGDADEDFIEFVGTSGAGTTTSISTQALGTYRGKVQITVNGSKFFVPYYD